ncbi:hypothetical protein PHYBOEH_001257 [Phytophthora boehmeriae]|uniref:Uncharacterized protein n=1 Tax=Phytophthora boehmeriae TaxID=109152 RepID=A0A8T1WUH4_9STRA|nr:hypothetical protein PHYBOEH_001257 [Phytophthora boehmeriae]
MFFELRGRVCDKIGVNAHLFFNPGTTADGGEHSVADDVKRLWPEVAVDGDRLAVERFVAGQRRQSCGCWDVLQRVPAVEQLHGREILLPNVRHSPYRSEEYDKTFGLITSDSQDKFTMATAQVSTAIQQVGSVAQQTYEQTGSTVQQNYEVTPASEATLAQTPEATTAVPEHTQVPTGSPAMHQSSGSADNTTTAGSSETQFESTSTSGSVSGSGDAGFAPWELNAFEVV